MPTYDYECQSCKKEFSVVHSISKHDKEKVACPECKSKRVKQLVSTFTVQTSKKS